jgi:hypothetical protein
MMGGKKAVGEGEGCVQRLMGTFFARLVLREMCTGRYGALGEIIDPRLVVVGSSSGAIVAGVLFVQQLPSGVTNVVLRLEFTVRSGARGFRPPRLLHVRTFWGQPVSVEVFIAPEVVPRIFARTSAASMIFSNGVVLERMVCRSSPSSGSFSRRRHGHWVRSDVFPPPLAS